MNNAYLNAIAAGGGELITHIALVDSSGNELDSSGYERKAVTWTAPTNGLIRPTADLVFEVAAGDVVAGWVGYSALTGGTAYGGADLSLTEFNNAGTYTLLAAATGIDHSAE